MKRIIAYLEQNVVGRLLETDRLVYTLDGGTLKGVYQDKISFCNLRSSSIVLSFDMFIAAEEKVYEQSGTEEEVLVKDHTAISLWRYELAVRPSTDAITGFFRMVSATGNSVSAQGIVSSLYDVTLKKDRLCMTEDQALYRDQATGKDAYKPVAFHADQCFYMEDGKLRFAYEGESFDVDPQTHVRSSSEDRFPTFLAKEK
jgi:hypothetical protein